IPAGSKIYTQSHYLNTTDEDITAQDVIDFHLLTKDKVTNVAGAFVEIDLGFELPPQQDVTRVVDCHPPMDMTVPWMIPHMHELGFDFKLELIHQNAEPTMLYQSLWSTTLRDHFPLVNFDPALQISPTDRLRTTCTWHNNTDTMRLFPNEMCATFMPFWNSPDGALLACDENGNQLRP